NFKVPLIVVVDATAVGMSKVTVLAAMIVTALQAVGINPVFQVAESLQTPVPTFCIAWQVLPLCQRIWLPLSFFSWLSPARAPEYCWLVHFNPWLEPRIV